MVVSNTASAAKDTTSVTSIVDRRYDAIIVGGGVAGLVAAARLSECPHKAILVIEAGADRRGDPCIDTPGMLMTLWDNDQYDWKFCTAPQVNLNGRIIPQPRGKVLGGSSAINVAAIVYPTKRNFDSWARLGNQKWTHESMAPYYRKFHTFHPASIGTSNMLALDSYMDPKLQGSDGPLAASFPDAYGPFNEAWLPLFNNAGFENCSDPILGSKLGAFHPPNSVDPKINTRSYAASAYYDSTVESRPNLDLLTEAQVAKLLLEECEDGVEAKGVLVRTKDGQLHKVFADQVILAAGALQTPQILEQSGIGSRKILEKHGIHVYVDNAGVGSNLQDHCFSTVSFEVADGQISADIVRDSAVVEALVQQYMETRTGPLSGIPMSLAYMPPVDIDGRMTPEKVRLLVQNHLDLNDAQLHPGTKAQMVELQDMVLDPNESTCFYGLMPSQMHVQAGGKTSMSQAYSQQRPENYITIMVGLNHPLSRGSVHIDSSDPFESPLIDPAYLSHPLDVEILARGTQFIEKLTNHTPLRELLKPAGRRLPGSASALADLSVAKQVMKERLWTTYHPCCTCAMLPRELGGVVNDRLQVYGTKNVRVIDASIFPMITLGNIQATVYAVAERASDLIKEDWAAMTRG